MAVDYFLKIDGVVGESTDAKHKGEIEPLSFGWGVAQPAASPGGGGGAGKAQFRDFAFVQRTGTSSTTLFLACATGKHLKNAILTGRKAGKTPFEFLTIKLSDVLVSSIDVSAADGEHPLEQVTLRYARIELSYRPQGPAGKALPALTAGFDLKKNKPV